VSKSAKKTKSTANIESTETRHLRIYKEIRERISLLKYTPGTVLSETELAREFEVSRTPIRRVLQRLHHEGLTEVKDIDLKTLKEIYDLRMHLAELMGELSPTEFTKSQLDTLRQLLKDAKALKKQQDYEAYARLCNSLEDVILTMIGSAPLREITDILYYRVSRIWFTFLPHLKWKELVGFQEEEIASMIEAVKRNDLKGVGQIRRLHLHGILTYLSNYLTNQTTK
jgi:DNA-binding GntR family transcriptional regulator